MLTLKPYEVCDNATLLETVKAGDKVVLRREMWTADELVTFVARFESAVTVKMSDGSEQVHPAAWLLPVK